MFAIVTDNMDKVPKRMITCRYLVRLSSSSCYSDVDTVNRSYLLLGILNVYLLIVSTYYVIIPVEFRVVRRGVMINLDRKRKARGVYYYISIIGYIT